MDIISSNAHFRQRVLKYSSRYGVSAASRFYRVSRNAIYEWRAKYDGKAGKVFLIKATDRIIIPMNIHLKKKK